MAGGALHLFEACAVVEGPRDERCAHRMGGEAALEPELRGVFPHDWPRSESKGSAQKIGPRRPTVPSHGIRTAWVNTLSARVQTRPA
jgi:hypothetical protein